MTNMTLQQWLVRIESMHPKEIELGLGRIREVARTMGILELTSKLVIVGGTNGKGSTVATIEALAIQNGYRVGAYTSPHLIDFNERIRLQGKMADDASLLEAFECIEAQRGDIALTFFEFTTLAALWIFAQNQLDLVILEVGLGGRLDAVNIVTPDVSVITSIGLDHTDWLGDSLESIAREKAGIFRPLSVNLTADVDAARLLAKVAPEFPVTHCRKGAFPDQIESLITANLLPVPEENFRVACAAFSALYPNQLSAPLLKKAINNIRLPGRFQELAWQVPIVADVAHNPPACRWLAQRLENRNIKGRRIMICGMMKDKAIAEILRLMAPTADYWIFVDLPGERAEKAGGLQQIFHQLDDCNASETAESVSHAMNLLAEKVLPGDELVVFGSFITVGNLLQYLGDNHQG